MTELEFIWTDGNNEVFHKFYLETEDYYSSIVLMTNSKVLSAWR